jgi:3D (Asp-Asp-Asp) domain-containing protein
MTRRLLRIAVAATIVAGLIAAFLFWLSLYTPLSPNGDATTPPDGPGPPQTAAEASTDPCTLEDVSCGREREISAFNSVRSQTDSAPCVAASGIDICEMHEQGIRACASNGFAFGTRLYIETVGECVVVDRMHPRYPHRVDVHFGNDIESINQARAFGVRTLEVHEL